MTAHDATSGDQPDDGTHPEEPSLTGAPTTYANGFALLGMAFGMQLIFTLKNGPAEAPVTVANVHVSPQLAKAIGRLLRRNILQFETQTGAPIPLPDAVLDSLNIRDIPE